MYIQRSFCHFKSDTASRESDNSLELDDGVLGSQFAAMSEQTSERAALVAADMLDSSTSGAFDKINVEL